MGLTQRIAPKGLGTEPNALQAGAAGYLRQCHNVLAVRPGLLEPPFGVARSGAITATSPGANYRIRSLIPYDHGSQSDVLVISKDGSNWDARWAIGGAVVGGGAGNFGAPPVDVESQDHKALIARKNLYLLTQYGLRKLTAPGDDQQETMLHEVGMILTALSSAGTPVMLADTKVVAYRALIARTDANGYIIRSAPSPYKRLINDAGGAAVRDGIVTVPLPGYVAAGDRLELYRSKAATGVTSIPSDELFLAHEHVIAAADVVAGYVEITDVRLESMLGAPLYTNGSQEGIALANDPPPSARDAALFGGCAWYADLLYRYGAKIAITLVDVTDGLQRIRHTGGAGAGVVFTNGSPIATMPTTAGLVAGMLVSDNLLNPRTVAGTCVPIGTKILSVDNGTTITMTANATATNPDRTADFRDVVTIGNTDLYYGVGSVVPPDQVGERVFGASGSTTEELARSAAENFAYVASRVLATTYTVQAIDELTVMTGQLWIREAYPGNSAFTLATSRTTAFTPKMQNTSYSTGTASHTSRDELPGGLAFSKLDKPEAVPIPYKLLLGDASRRRILRIFRQGESLLVLKEDGVFRVTGTGPDQWRVSEVNANVWPLAADCCCDLDGVVYAFTNRGIVAIDGGGVTFLSDPVIGDQLRDTQRTLGIGTLTLAARTNLFVVAHKRRRLLMFHFPVGQGIGDSSGVGIAVCTSPATGAFTTRGTRAEGWVAAAYSERADMLFVARGGAYWEIRVERTAEQTATSNRDDTHNITISTVVAAGEEWRITLSAADGWAPAVGDVVTQTRLVGETIVFARAHVTAIHFSGDAIVDQELDADAAVAIEGMPTTLDWQPITGRVAAEGALYRLLHLFLQELATSGPGSLRWRAGGSTNRSTTATTTQYDRAISPVGHGRPLRGRIGRAVARAAQFFARVELDEPETYWAISGIALEGELTSERTVKT